MCGLVGVYSSNMMGKHKDVLSSLLYLDTFRGKDSTGVAAIRHNADTHTLKSTVPGYEFVEGNRLEQHLRLNDICWIGHNRFGTIGANVKFNAHPFEVLDEDGTCLLVGAHNGTLKNKTVLNDHNQFGTDSEALFNHIAFNGIDNTIPLIEGAWALTWYDHIEEELRMLRNDERTLFYAWEEGRKTLFWASESWMIRVATSRHGVKLEEDKVYVIPPDTLLRFPVPMKLNSELTCERKGGLVGKTTTFFQEGEYRHTYQRARDGGRAWDRRAEQTPQTQQQTEEKAAQEGAATDPKALLSMVSGTPSEGGEKPPQTSEKKSEKPSKSGKVSVKGGDNVVALEGARSYKGYAGVLYSKKEILKQLEDGCAWCETTAININDRYGWLAPKKPVCHECLKGRPKPEDKILDVQGVTVH